MNSEVATILLEQMKMLQDLNEKLVERVNLRRECEPEQIAKNVLAMVEIAKIINR